VLDGTLNAITHHCNTSLTALDIRDMKFISNTAMLQLASKCPNLRKLECTLHPPGNVKCSSSPQVINALGFRHVWRPLLVHKRDRAVFGYDGLTTAGVMEVVKRCPALEYLHVGQQGEDAIRVNEDHRPRTSVYQVSLDPPILLAMAAHSQNLRVMKLRGHHALLTDAGYEAIARSCTKLEEIDIILSESVSELSVRSVLIGCRALRQLLIFFTSFKGASQSQQCLTDAAFQGEQPWGRHLERLCIAGSHITDVALTAIAENCTRLKLIDMTGCEGITQVGISRLVQGCRRLRAVHVRNCKQLLSPEEDDSPDDDEISDDENSYESYKYDSDGMDDPNDEISEDGYDSDGMDDPDEQISEGSYDSDGVPERQRVVEDDPNKAILTALQGKALQGTQTVVADPDSFSCVEINYDAIVLWSL